MFNYLNLLGLHYAQLLKIAGNVLNWGFLFKKGHRFSQVQKLTTVKLVQMKRTFPASVRDKCRGMRLPSRCSRLMYWKEANNDVRSARASGRTVTRRDGAVSPVAAASRQRPRLTDSCRVVERDSPGR